MEPVITVDHLTKRYKKSSVAAVDDISFDVAPGELFAFLGPNGAGKTTTISILTTILAKSSGTVTIAGHDLDHDATAVRESIGIIFQNPSLDQHLSGEENIRLHVAIYGIHGYKPFYRMMPADYRARIERLAAVVGLDEVLFKPVKTYSGLDPVSRHGLWAYLREVRNEDHTTIFLTTHYLEEAEEADRVCVIDHGRIAMIGTPDDMKRELLDRAILLDAADRPSLIAELRSLGLDPELDHNGLVRVAYDGETAHPIIARIRTPLSVLRVHDPSLEEAYVELLRRPDEEAVA
jgi:ABC-2 type transport system ATP-binding protein